MYLVGDWYSGRVAGACGVFWQHHRIRRRGCFLGRIASAVERFGLARYGRELAAIYRDLVPPPRPRAQ